MPEILPLVTRLFVSRNDQQPEEEQPPEGRGLAEGLLRRRRGRQAQPENTFAEVESEEEEEEEEKEEADPIQVFHSNTEMQQGMHSPQRPKAQTSGPAAQDSCETSRKSGS